MVILNETLDEATAWQKLCENLVKIYGDKYSYSQVLNCLVVSKAMFYNNLKENKENEEKSS